MQIFPIEIITKYMSRKTYADKWSSANPLLYISLLIFSYRNTSIKPTHNGTVFILDLCNLATKQGNVAFTEHFVL